MQTKNDDGVRSSSVNLKIWHGGKFIMKKEKMLYDGGSLDIKLGVTKLDYFSVTDIITRYCGCSNIGSIWYRKKSKGSSSHSMNNLTIFSRNSCPLELLESKDEKSGITLFVEHDNGADGDNESDSDCDREDYVHKAYAREEKPHSHLPQNPLRPGPVPIKRNPSRCSNCGILGPEATNASEERKFNLNDLSEHSSPENYLAKGGGFCAEEDEVEADAKAEKETDCEYMQMGDEFCMEDEGNLYFRVCDGGRKSNNTDAYVSATLTETKEAGHVICPCNTITAPASVPDTVRGLQKVTINDVAPTPLNPFSGLPYMKRMKR